MTAQIGSSINTNDVADISSGVSLNSTTSTKIADANDRRIFFCVNNNDNNNGVWIKLQAASVDNDKKGIFLTKKTGARIFFDMPPGNIYTGEISAIAEASSPTIFTTEY